MDVARRVSGFRGRAMKSRFSTGVGNDGACLRVPDNCGFGEISAACGADASLSRGVWHFPESKNDGGASGLAARMESEWKEVVGRDGVCEGLVAEAA